MHWSDVWFGQGAAPAALRVALTPLSWLYAGCWNAYLGVYALGLKRAKSPHAPIVCVGNLTVGGSGKTPATVCIAKLLRDLGREVVVGCSGYGSPAQEGARLAQDGRLAAMQWGDEPALFRWLLGEMPLIVGRDRVRAAQICHENFPHAVLLMDDGFQHLPLAKSISILLDPPLPNRRCLPAGPYREPVSRLHRADLVIPGEFVLERSRLDFMKLDETPAETPPEADVLCALGSPQGFLSDLRALGIEVRQARLLPDHDSLAGGNLWNGGLGRNRPVIVTAKDWMKLRDRTDLNGKSLIIARQAVSIQPAEEFAAWLDTKLHEAAPKN